MPSKKIDPFVKSMKEAVAAIDKNAGEAYTLLEMDTRTGLIELAQIKANKTMEEADATAVSNMREIPKK